MTKKYIKSIVILIAIIVGIELLERGVDFLFGDKDGQISNFYVRILILLTEIFLFLTIGIAIVKLLVEKKYFKSTKISVRVFTIIIILTVFGVAEIYIRLSSENVNLLQLTGKKLMENPMRKWAVGEAFCGYAPIANGIYEHKDVNNLGFISPDINVEKPDSVIRIVFIGGSSTAGHGLKTIEDTWPYKTYRFLQKKLPNYKFDYINAAVGGYCTFTSYGRFWSRERFFKPDIVIINHGWNDMGYFHPGSNILKWRRGLSNWNIDNDVRLKIYNPLFIDKFICWSQLFSQLRLKFTKSIAEGEVNNTNLYEKTELADKLNKEAPGVYIDNLKLFKGLADNLHATTFICKQPTLVSLSLPDSLRYKCRNYHGLSYKAHAIAFDSIYNAIDGFLPEKQIIDLTSMNGEPEYFRDHIHPNEKGSTRYAEIVSDKLTEFIKHTPKFN